MLNLGKLGRDSQRVKWHEEPCWHSLSWLWFHTGVTRGRQKVGAPITGQTLGHGGPLVTARWLLRMLAALLQWGFQS